MECIKKSDQIFWPYDRISTKKLLIVWNDIKYANITNQQKTKIIKTSFIVTNRKQPSVQQHIYKETAIHTYVRIKIWTNNYKWINHQDCSIIDDTNQW